MPAQMEIFPQNTRKKPFPAAKAPLQTQKRGRPVPFYIGKRSGRPSVRYLF